MIALTDRFLDFVLSPALWLSLALALLVSLAFTAWRGGDLRQLLRDLLAGIVGFAAGQFVGFLLGFPWLRVGRVHVLWGLLGSAGALLLGRAFWQWRQQPRGARSARR
jgi:hypothetical protein